MIGSHGSLAVITQINFKVFPKPVQTRTFICSFASLDEAIAFRNKILRHRWPDVHGDCLAACARVSVRSAYRA